MLKGVDALVGPELLLLLAEMGHGDVLAVVDRNYPAHSSGVPVVELATDLVSALRAILTLFPVDTFIDPPAWHMLQDDGSAGPAMPDVQVELDATEGRSVPFAGTTRPDFYAAARGAYVVVRTVETRPYACVLLSKGVV